MEGLIENGEFCGHIMVYCLSGAKNVQNKVSERNKCGISKVTLTGGDEVHGLQSGSSQRRNRTGGN